MTLEERLVALHRALTAAGVPHAFGGAIALAYSTLNPRGTSDIDVNIFLPAAEASSALAALPEGVGRPPSAIAAIARDEQVRLWWDQTPVDVFFDYAPVHADAARNARMVPFHGTRIPVLGPVELAVFKIVYDRTRDWADIEEMLAVRTLDVDAARQALEPMLAADDRRFDRLDELVHRAAQE